MKSYKTIWINGEQKRLHRYVMECALGRVLSANEVVHHINGDKFDNRLANLELMTRAEHTRLHEAICPSTTRFKKKYDVSIEALNVFLANGETVKEIARRYGSSDNAIQHIIDSHGLRAMIPKIHCSICGEIASYKKSKLCNKHYHQQYHQKNKRVHVRNQ